MSSMPAKDVLKRVYGECEKSGERFARKILKNMRMFKSKRKFKTRERF